MQFRPRVVAVAAIAMAVTATVVILGASVPSTEAAASQPGVEDGFTFAAAGDLIGPANAFNLDADPETLRIADLFRRADLGFANNESSIFDLASFRGSPAAENGGGYLVSEAGVAQSYKAAGINLVSKANNHATDWGVEGLEATLESLAAAGIVQAGAGASLDEARAPRYLDTKRGRVGLVSTASTFPPMAVAGNPVERNGIPSRPRPGISTLRVRLIKQISPQDFVGLQRAGGGVAFPTPGRDDEARIGDVIFRKSDSVGMTWEMEPSDETALLASVREARANANFVVFAIHAHQTAGDEDKGPDRFQPEVLHYANEAAGPVEPRPADFERKLFHDVIDAGADAVVRTGPHVLNGIEIYKGKLIFYSLGSLFWPFGARRDLGSTTGDRRSAMAMLTIPETSETVVPVVVYKGGRASDVRLHPVVIDPGPGPTAFFPRPAAGTQALKILERLKAMSAEYGTIIRIEGEVGVIQP